MVANLGGPFEEIDGSGKWKKPSKPVSSMSNQTNLSRTPMVELVDG